MKMSKNNIPSKKKPFTQDQVLTKIDSIKEIVNRAGNLDADTYKKNLIRLFKELYKQAPKELELQKQIKYTIFTITHCNDYNILKSCLRARINVLKEKIDPQAPEKPFGVW